MGRDGEWRRAAGASVTADGGCTNNKMAAGGVPPALPPPSHPPLAGVAPRRQLGPWTKGLFCERRERARVPCQFFLNVWQLEILAGPPRKANHNN